MEAINLESTLTFSQQSNTNIKQSKSWLETYYNYCDKQYEIVWYIIPLMVLSCVIFPIGFLIQYIQEEPAVWYFTISGINLFSNILPNFVDASNRVKITNFYLTVLLHVVLWFFLF